MINANMRIYDYYTFGDDNGYGQPTISTEAKGSVKMSITVSSQRVQDNIRYKGAEYIGLTHDAQINDTWVIAYGDERLKVLYVTPTRLKQVFMTRV